MADFIITMTIVCILLNQIEELADEILQVLAISGLKHYNDLREGFNENRD